jgi:hypothetical protein
MQAEPAAAAAHKQAGRGPLQLSQGGQGQELLAAAVPKIEEQVVALERRQQRLDRRALASDALGGWMASWRATANSSRLGRLRART